MITFQSALSIVSAHAASLNIPREQHATRLLKHQRHFKLCVALQIFGIAGTNVAPDRNYIAHNATHEALGVGAVYMPYRVEDFASFKQAAADHQLTGYSVTMPHKAIAFQHPTITLKNRQLCGVNRMSATNDSYGKVAECFTHILVLLLMFKQCSVFGCN